MPCLLGHQTGRGRCRGKFIVIVLPTFAGLKTIQCFGLKITKKKKGSGKEVHPKNHLVLLLS